MPSVRGLIDPIDLLLPYLPSSLEGLKIAHLSDLHIRRFRRLRHRQIRTGLELMRVDLVLFTGDYIEHPGDEQIGLAVMRMICEKIRARVGIFGVFGNHDTQPLRPLFEQLPIHWLHDACCCPAGVPLEIIGLDTGVVHYPDAVAALASLADQRGKDRSPPSQGRTVRLMLSHLPTYLPTAADMGVDLMFSGHTHGGQCRLPGMRAVYNSTDLPLGLTSGILRHKQTLCLVSRGLGEAWVPIRTFCKPHLPVYTLRRGPMPGQPTEQVVNVLPW